MSDNLAWWATVRTEALKEPAEAERLRGAAKSLQRLVPDPGWVYVQRWLATKQREALGKILSEPPTDVRADAYALKKAYHSGFLDGLQKAFDTPEAILKIAKQVELAKQQAAEAAEE